jgi:stage III sporulation protein AH
MLDRQRTRDEAIEVLQGVVDNAEATAEMKTNAGAEISKITQIMGKRSQHRDPITAKGFEKCVAVINGTDARP